jgi:hypothetical protein
MVTSCAIRDCTDRTGPLGSVPWSRQRSFRHTSTGGQALRQVLDLPFRVFGKPLVQRKKLLHRSLRVVIGAVVHAFKWTRPCFVAQANRESCRRPGLSARDMVRPRRS